MHTLCVHIILTHDLVDTMLHACNSDNRCRYFTAFVRIVGSHLASVRLSLHCCALCVYVFGLAFRHLFLKCCPLKESLSPTGFPRKTRQTIGSVLNKHERKSHRPVFCTLRQLVCHFTKLCNVQTDSRVYSAREYLTSMMKHHN